MDSDIEIKVSDDKKDSGSKKKIVIIALAVLLLIVAVVLFFFFKNISATTMRLLRVVGEVKLEENGKEKSIVDNMRLSNGNALSTGEESLVSIGLDDSKIVNLEELSRAEFYQKGKKLVLTLTKGRLFFDVREPLKENESMEIKSSTMVVGIRGTSGYVWIDEETGDEFVYLTDGEVDIVITDANGNTKTVHVGAGQRLRLHKNANGEIEAVVEDVAVKDLPLEILRELANYEATFEKALNSTGYDRFEMIQLMIDSDYASYISDMNVVEKLKKLLEEEEARKKAEEEAKKNKEVETVETPAAETPGEPADPENGNEDPNEDNNNNNKKKNNNNNDNKKKNNDGTGNNILDYNPNPNPNPDPPAEQPAAETPAAETPAAETPAAETPAAETPAAETPAAEDNTSSNPFVTAATTVNGDSGTYSYTDSNGVAHSFDVGPDDGGAPHFGTITMSGATSEDGNQNLLVVSINKNDVVGGAAAEAAGFQIIGYDASGEQVYGPVDDMFSGDTYSVNIPESTANQISRLTISPIY